MTAPPHLFEVKRVSARFNDDLALACQPPLTRRPSPPLLLLGVHQPVQQSRRGLYCGVLGAGDYSNLGAGSDEARPQSRRGRGIGRGITRKVYPVRARAQARAAQRTCPAQAQIAQMREKALRLRRCRSKPRCSSAWEAELSLGDSRRPLRRAFSAPLHLMHARSRACTAAALPQAKREGKSRGCFPVAKRAARCRSRLTTQGAWPQTRNRALPAGRRQAAWPCCLDSVMSKW